MRHWPEAKPLDERIMKHVIQDSAGCWLWTGHVTPKGYGGIGVEGRMRLAHSVAYEVWVGPVPPGLQLDHLCRVRHCCNPEHLEPVTPWENLRRGNTFMNKTHCPSGHAYEGANLYVDPGGGRRCRACKRLGDQRYIAARKGK